jgi:hypothetical protein
MNSRPSIAANVRCLRSSGRSFLAHLAETLLLKAEPIEQLLQELDRTGRRRGTAQTVSVAARLLLDSLRAWCADIEAAAGEIDSSELPEEVQKGLAGECRREALRLEGVPMLPETA